MERTPDDKLKSIIDSMIEELGIKEERYGSMWHLRNGGIDIFCNDKFKQELDKECLKLIREQTWKIENKH